jgi:hypothetical protein
MGGRVYASPERFRTSMSADKVRPEQKHLTSDAREFGLVVADAVLSEFKGEANEEHLHAIRNVLMQAVDHIEKQYGPESAVTWLDEANRAIQHRIAELNPRQVSSPDNKA